MRTAATLVVVLIAIAPIHAHGQALTPAQVESLRNAKNEVVIQVGGAEREIHGRVIDHTADVVTVSIDGRPYRIPMASVMRLDTLARPVEKRTAVGLLVGLGVGAWGALVGGQGVEGDFKPGLVVAATAAGGSAIGALTSLNARKVKKTIYRASGTVQPYTGPLPCPATPLVVTAPLVVPDRVKWRDSAWFGDYQSLGNGRCDGLAIRRANDDAAGTWQSGVELNFKDSGNGVVSVTARITAQLPAESSDKTAVVRIEILDGTAVLYSSAATIKAYSSREVSGLQTLLVSDKVLANSANLVLRLTITARYE